jgi:hypothetical protein
MRYNGWLHLQLESGCNTVGTVVQASRIICVLQLDCIYS